MRVLSVSMTGRGWGLCHRSLMKAPEKLFLTDLSKVS